MPLNYSSWEQVSGWRFLLHRLSVAVGRRSVRLVHDPSKNNTAALLVSAVVALLVVGLSFVMAFLKPVGQVGSDKLLADRANGALYVQVAGVMHPALNLASARLITGQAADPKMVPNSEIRNYPIGPTVGIVGAPNDLTVRSPSAAGWAMCDQLGSTGSLVVPQIAVINGIPELGDWAQPLASPRSALMAYGGDAYLVTDGHRSQIDLADKAVTLALGLDAGDLKPAPMSRALYEALTPVAPLQVPSIPTPGAPVAYASPQFPVVSGAVVRVADVSGAPQYYVALPGGIQPIPETAATMLRNAGVADNGAVVSAAATVVSSMPQTVGFDTSIYPSGPVSLVDKATEPVTCVMWRRDSGEPRARVSVVSGRRLPIPVGGEARLVKLVSAGPDVANEVYMAPDSANFVQVTGVEPASPRGESLWWISDSGVRFGVETAGQGEAQTRQSLGLDGSATPAPWAVIRWLPAGPALSKAAALTEHDTLAPDSSPAPLVIPQGGG
jgi:type VII secretion protein EccB